MKSKEKDTSVIPDGYYCYSLEKYKKNGKTKYRRKYCPYWSSDPKRPEQESGYCSYLEKGDWDINLEAEIYNIDKNNKKILVKKKNEPSNFRFSLLWDMCKECGIKDEYQEDDPQFDESINIDDIDDWENEGGK